MKTIDEDFTRVRELVQGEEVEIFRGEETRRN
jgi:hypothetical protein